jgi:hypothetical protein
VKTICVAGSAIGIAGDDDRLVAGAARVARMAIRVAGDDDRSVAVAGASPGATIASPSFTPPRGEGDPGHRKRRSLRRLRRSGASRGVERDRDRHGAGAVPGGGLRQGKVHDEAGAAKRSQVEADVTAVGAGDLADDGQTEPGTAAPARARAAEEGLEEPLVLRRGHAAPLVGDDELDGALAPGSLDEDAAARRRPDESKKQAGLVGVKVVAPWLARFSVLTGSRIANGPLAPPVARTVEYIENSRLEPRDRV